MSFLDVTFPKQFATAVESEDLDTTEIVAQANGREKRNASQEVMRRRFDMAAFSRTKAEAQAIYNFFRVVGGRQRSFRFWDWRHNTVTAGNIGTGDGATTVFPLRSNYAFGGQTVYHNETKPRAGVLVYVNGVLASPTVDLATGLVTFASAPADGAAVTATFSFDICVRFEQQRLRWKAVNGGKDGLVFYFDELSVIEVIGE